MSTISLLLHLSNGSPRQVDLSQNTLAVQGLQLNGVLLSQIGTYASYSGTIGGTSTSVTITASFAGSAGNSIALVFSGSNTISAAIASWNSSNPLNPAVLTSGDGTQIPTAQTVNLSGGVSAGSSTIADVASYTNFTPVNSTVAGALKGIDNALASVVGGAANQALSNLSATTAINSSLLPATAGAITLGSFTNPWGNAFASSWNLSDGVFNYGNLSYNTVLPDGTSSNLSIETTTHDTDLALRSQLGAVKAFGSALEVFGNSSPGVLSLFNTANTFSVGFAAPSSLSASVSWTLPSADGSSNQVLTTNGSGVLSWSNATAGSVTSVAFADASTMPIYSVSGSPVTSTGTLTQTLNTQAANAVFAGPSSGSAAQPSFRSLVAADIPSLSSVYVPQSEVGAASGVASLDSGGKVPLSQLPASLMEFQGNWNPTTNTPTLVDGTGTTGYTYWVSALDTGTVAGLTDPSMTNFQIGDLVIYNGTKWVLVTPAAGVQSVNGSQGATVVNAISQLTGDVTTSAASGSQSLAASLVATSNATLTTLSALTTASSLSSVGTITSGTWNGSAIAIAHGGTGQTTPSAAFNALSPMTTGGDLIYGGTSGVATRLANGTSGQVLTSNGGTSAPSWQTITSGGSVTSVAMSVPSFLSVSGSPITSSGTLAVSYSGTALPIANGGTGQTTTSSAFNALSPLTTKGDTLTYSTTNVRQAVPNDYGSFIPDSTQATGWRTATYLQDLQGRPGKNYILYSDMENNSTTGWSLGTVGTLTNGIPTGTPTFGSGASANLSISTVSSGQLAGAYSLSYVSSAATTAGNMLASQAYTIDAADQAKVLTFKFYYSVPTGTANCNFSGTSSNSFGIAIYDVTNSSWLSSTANFGITQGTGTGYVTGTCQTNATTASLRFAVYNANATTGACTLYFDDFYLGPQTAPLGFAGTDWASYTPTFGTGFGTPTSINVMWKRVGDTLQVQGTFITGTVSAAAATISLPNGYTINTSKLSGSSTNQVLGTGYVNETGTNNSKDFVVLCAPASSTSLMYFALPDTAGANSPLVPQNANIFSYSTTLTSLSFTVPIQGWSSNVQMSSDTDTRVVSFTGNRASAAATANTTIPTWTTVKDTHGAFNATTGVYAVPVSGDYYVNFYNVAVTSSSAGPEIYHNGTLVATGAVATSGSTNGIVSVLIPNCAANDTITFAITTSLTVAGNANIFRLSGPSSIAATESVRARYTSTAGPSIGTSTALVIFNTQTYDSHGAYNTSTGLYTCPVSGEYQVIAKLDTAAIALSSNLQVSVSLYKNGAFYSEMGQTYGNGTSQGYRAAGTDTVTCLAGDTLAVYAASGVATTMNTTAGINFISFRRTGN